MDKYLETSQAKADADGTQELYKKRLDILVPIFEQAGLKLACPSDAGFFMLFECPKSVDGEATPT